MSDEYSDHGVWFVKLEDIVYRVIPIFPKWRKRDSVSFH